MEGSLRVNISLLLSPLLPSPNSCEIELALTWALQFHSKDSLCASVCCEWCVCVCAGEGEGFAAGESVDRTGPPCPTVQVKGLWSAHSPARQCWSCPFMAGGTEQRFTRLVLGRVGLGTVCSSVPSACAGLPAGWAGHTQVMHANYRVPLARPGCPCRPCSR